MKQPLLAARSDTYCSNCSRSDIQQCKTSILIITTIPSICTRFCSYPLQYTDSQVSSGVCECEDSCKYRNFRTISRDFFPQLLTLRLKQRMRLIYGFFSMRGASHPRLFLASFQLTSKLGATIRTSLCSVLFISKVSQKFVSIFKHSVEWSIHNNF